MLTQDDYKLYTGSAVNFTEEQWEKLVNMAASRLAGFLCRNSLGVETTESFTAQEYDNLGLTAQEYDDKELTAEEYDNGGLALSMAGGEARLPEDLEFLLANFLNIMLNNRGDSQQVSSKKVRNFTITYATSAKSAYGKLRRLYGDIIEKYSKCNGGVCVERGAKRCCYGCI